MMQLAGLLLFLTDVHSLGLETAQGIVLTDSFYWDLNDRTRAFSDRHVAEDRRGAAHHGAGRRVFRTLHYLKVASAMGVAAAKADGAATVARLKAMPTDDDCFGAGSIRIDGRALHPAYLWEVKKPSESKGPSDYYKLVATTPADQAFRPLRQGGCPLVKT